MALYNIVFTGEIVETYELEVVQENFKSHFQLSDIKVQYLFSGKEITLKKNLTQDKALECAALLDGLGGVVYVEPVMEKVELPPGVYFDRRVEQRRKKVDRRNHYRAGITSDRRVHPERRKNPFKY